MISYKNIDASGIYSKDKQTKFNAILRMYDEFNDEKRNQEAWKKWLKVVRNCINKIKKKDNLKIYDARMKMILLLKERNFSKFEKYL